MRVKRDLKPQHCLKTVKYIPRMLSRSSGIRDISPEQEKYQRTTFFFPDKIIIDDETMHSNQV